MPHFLFVLALGSTHTLCSGKPAYDKILNYIQKAKDAGGEVLIGGTGTFSTVAQLSGY